MESEGLIGKLVTSSGPPGGAEEMLVGLASAQGLLGAREEASSDLLVAIGDDSTLALLTVNGGMLGGITSSEGLVGNEGALADITDSTGLVGSLLNDKGLLIDNGGYRDGGLAWILHQT